MLGFTTKAEARQIGVSHHGSYYGIPMWLGDVDSDCPLAFAKWVQIKDHLKLVFEKRTPAYPAYQSPPIGIPRDFKLPTVTC
ncbi:hypothetical protein [Pseudomonas aeruginosa]|uniref:hypothetical protein n=1 Tax=Pseudomonas aeruginosa TaxID=287 RepID=UPI00132B9A01|nr:hypothetical protein [Pseudomonas aeruginosa]MXP71749.1 hypothetical protein [Pseudomonas aeruginosa]MXP89660.1 hypothetical protein [Pseudomonas aeruginosa]MXQ02983.1 hypothetical protein [Pseudomonas aeruginosa]MXQ16328.1 hypothetical protein [Pseudomonas aeruginosa]MXQ29660.1 hypothetical protein [Pseudomonas aeruginosa]